MRTTEKIEMRQQIRTSQEQQNRDSFNRLLEEISSSGNHRKMKRRDYQKTKAAVFRRLRLLKGGVEMRAPSKSIARSLREQRVGGCGPEIIEVREQRRGGPSMVASGEGKVVAAPAGPDRALDERSARRFADSTKRFGGE
jgi:hypothetical protein